jgi:hypothetical protein
MHLVTHILASWTAANIPELERRDRAIVTLAGVVPDLDSAGIVVEIATKHSATTLPWYSMYHHMLAHNLVFGLTIFVAAMAVARRRLVTASLSFAVFHFHLLCDLIGSRGPDGYPWPIPYLYPFSRNPEIAWSGQWELNAWPNVVFTIVLLVVTFYLAWTKGFSPLEIISKRADQSFVGALRNRFGSPRKYSYKTA